MSALAMILMAAMAVPGNGPEMVSGEIEQGLDLRGEWEGSWYQPSGGVCPVRLKGNELRVSRNNGDYDTHEFECTDARQGTVNVILVAGGILTTRHRGIYKQENEWIFICYSESGLAAPSSFRPSTNQWLFILHRVKPRK